MKRTVILAYHGVGDVDDRADPVRLIVSPRHLAAHVRTLRRLGFRFRTIEEILDEAGGEAPAGRTAALTFDDGWRNGLTVALPLLEDLGVRATFYVCPGWWSGTHPDVPGDPGRILSEDEARTIHERGMELGSHSMVHADLRELDPAALAEDLRGSKAAIERITGRPCRTFAYPFGLFGPREEGAVAEAGYELGLAWLPGPWRPMAVPRLPGPPRHGGGRLSLKLLGVRRRRG